MISIDGIRGVGKTTQINMLARHFRGMGVDILVIKSGEDVDSGVEAIEKTNTFLEKENTMVIMDGSVARMMVVELVSGIAETVVTDKYKSLINGYERLNHKYGIVGLLMVMDDLEECNKRILKKSALSGLPEAAIDNPAVEVDIVSGMRFFNNHVASKSVKFHTFNIEASNSMLDIQKLILSYLSENYKIKQPKKDPNDW